MVGPLNMKECGDVDSRNAIGELGCELERDLNNLLSCKATTFAFFNVSYFHSLSNRENVMSIPYLARFH